MDLANAKHIINNAFNNQYEFIKLLGEGGFAQVWLVKQKFIKDKRAIKIMKEALDEDSNTVDEVFNEVEVATRLKHKNIISIYDAGTIETYGTDEKGLYILDAKKNAPIKKWAYFVLEYVSGGDLEQYRQSYIKSDIQIPLNIVLDVIKQILQGLNTLHLLNKPIIHRDIKTGNILLSYDNRGQLLIKISDFGIAGEISGIKSDEDIGGTRPYMAPECFENKNTTRTDIYAVGVIFYLLLTNHYPYDSDRYDNEDFINRIPWTNNLVKVSEYNDQVPEEIEEMIYKCLSVNPQKRYKDANEFLKHLNEYISEHESENVDREDKIHSHINDEDNNNVLESFELAKCEMKLDEAIELLEKEVFKDYEIRRKYSYRLKLWKSDNPDIKLVMQAFKVTLKGSNYQLATDLLEEAIAYNPDIKDEYFDYIELWKIMAKLEEDNNLFEAVKNLEELMERNTHINQEYGNIISVLKTYSVEKILEKSLELKQDNRVDDAAKLLEFVVICDRRIEKKYSYKLSLWKQNIEM